MTLSIKDLFSRFVAPVDIACLWFQTLAWSGGGRAMVYFNYIRQPKGFVCAAQTLSGVTGYQEIQEIH